MSTQPVHTQPIAARVTSKDWAVLERPLSEQSADEVVPLVRHADAEVRELAVNALDKIGGAAAKEALFQALSDRSDLVRAFAARALHNHVGAGDLQAVIGQMRKHSDDYVREQMALLLGKMGDKTAVVPLQEQMKAETYPTAQHAQSLALAKLGDAVQRQAYLASLKQSDPVARAAAVEDLLYLRDRALALEARPLLNDKADARNAAPSHGHLMVRVCDITIDVLDKVLDHPFPFPIEYAKRYSESEISAADGVLRKLK